MNGKTVPSGTAAAWRTWGLGLGLAAAAWAAPQAVRADLAEGFETGMPTAYSTGDYALGSGTWSFVNVIRGTTKYAGSYACQIRSSTGAEARSPVLSGGVGTISFWVYSSIAGGGLQVNLSSDGGSTWTPASGSPFTGLTSAWVQKQIVVDDSGVDKVQFLRTAGTIYLDEVAITASAAATPPSFGANPGPLGATSGVAMAFTVTATGSPTPTLALPSTTASSGYSFTAGTGQLAYTPPLADGGATQTFTFTASNSAGVATQTVGVAVTAAAAPAFTSGASYGATTGVERAFTVTASGTPAPTLALLSEDAAGDCAFVPGTGVLTYTPVAGDVGTRTFTFTASNVAGGVTQAVSVTVADVAVAPTFTSGTSYGATALVAMAFTVTAGGNPAPTLALESEDAAGSVAFTPATGVLAYTPATNDVGSRSFTFTASNTAGTATQTVTVAVAAAPTDIPTVGVANVTTNSFTVNWTACTGATNYQVQVATDTNFVAGSSSEALTEDFATLTDTAVPSGWSTDKSSDLDYTGEPYVGAAAPAYKFGTSGQWLASPAFAPGATNLQFWAYGNGGAGSTIAVSALVASAWTLVDTVAIAANDGTYTVALDPQTTQLKFGFTKVYNCGFDDVVVQAVSASASLVLDQTLAALTTAATGLDMSTTYYVRARKEGGEWSEIVSATTADPAPTAPVFGANPGPIAATATLAKAFAVTATGFPAPTLSLQGTTASTGYVFAAETGVLDYAPPEADVGAQSFTFAASNSAGVAWQTVTVAVAAAPVYVPTVAVTNVGPTSFTANWNEVTDAATYQIQIGTDTNFSAAAVGSNVLSQTFATLTDSTPPSGWTSSHSSDLDSTTYYGAAPPAFKFNVTGQWLQSPAFAAGGTNLQFWAFGRNGSGSTFAISGLVAGVWTLVDTVSIARNGATYNVPLDPQTTQIKFSFTRIVSVFLDDVVVQSATTAGSLLVDETVAARTYGATGLEIMTPYYVRVRAAPTGTWSAVVSATTLGNDPVLPWFTGGAGPFSTTAGVATAFTVSAMGVPDPALALPDSTAAAGSYAFATNTGYFIYTPPLGDAGTQSFTFTASNEMGVATQVVEVAVAAATAPAFTSGTSYGATTLVTRVINVEAAGAPAPTLALAGTTTSTNDYSFSPELGRLSYTPPTNDVGPQTFTFTAGNLAGVATQTVTIVVSNMPAVAPAIDALPPQTTMVGLEFDYTVTATDPDTAASNLTFACTSAVASATWAFDTNSGYFVFIPTTNQIGTNVFAFQATDHPTSLTSPWSNLVVVVSAAGDPVSVSFGSARIVGEEGAGTLLIPVNLAYAGSASMQFRFTGPTNGTALRGADFNCSTTLVISGASSGNLVLDLANDVLPEGPESVKITLVPVAPATAGAITQTVVHLRDDDTVAIMAANTTSGANQEYEAPGNRIFQALCPDVALVQEFNMTNGTTEAVYRTWVDQAFGTNFSYCHEPLASANIPNGIVSRWPIVEYGEWDDTTLSDRDFVWAKIDLPGDKYLYAVSLHIKASSGYESQRTTETRMLTNYIAQAGWSTNDYVVIGGDFNLQVRTETALAVLTAKVVSDAHQSADQVGNKNTNSGRDNPYDLVLPSPGLDARHRTFYFGGYAFANGVVYDTRIAWASGLPAPSLAADSAAVNMQHMGALKIFELEKDDEVGAPQAFAATPVAAGQIDLDFTRNAVGDDVIVVWNATGAFTTPAGTPPAAGAAFAGGTVLYKGAVSPLSHTGLTACTVYAYKCWSYAGTVYSTNGLAASAETEAPAAPASIWASGVGNETFTANWSAVAGVAGYRLDVCGAPSFSGAGAGWGPVFRETMGTPLAGTTTLAEHEANDGFDNDAYDMSSGGADNPADVRTSTVSTNYVDPAGNPASGAANVYFPTNGLTGTAGFALAGIDTRGYQALALSFGYYKESATQNMQLGVDWSTDGGATWSALAVSNALPAANAAQYAWYSVSNLALDAAALGATNLSLRWVRADGSVPGRIDDVLLQGYADSAEFVASYSNRTVGGTSLVVTGLTGGATYYFRVAAAGGSCASAWSPTGTATPTGTPAAPAFTSADTFGATTGVARTFAVTAAGYPKPALTLQGTTASGGHGFDAGTGVLTYAPPEADVGAKTFTFKASNDSGAVTQIVTAVVAAGLPSAPAAIWASATNAAGFTAAWSASALATGYRLDVSTEPTFQVLSGGSVQTVLASNAATDVSLIAGAWSGTDLVGTNGYVQMLQPSSEIVSPAFSTVGYTNLTIDFWARTYGGTAGTSSNVTVSISTNDGAAWTALGVVAPTNGAAWLAMPTLADVAHLGHAQTRIRWQTLAAVSNVGVGVKTLVVQGASPAYAPSYVAGWSNAAVAGTSQAVTGLAELTAYYFRVRAENPAGTSGPSPTAGATTLEAQLQDQTIAFAPLGDWLATDVVGLSATASSGLPVSFAVASGPASVVDGTLTFAGAGTVSIVASQAGDAAWNPAPNVTNTFTVTKDMAVVTLGDLSQAYDGTPKSATATTEPAGLAVTLTYDGSATAPSATGTYEVVALVAEALYAGGATGTLTIAESLSAFAQWLQGRALDPQDVRYDETADDDGDGATTYEEYLADTDPTAAGSVLGLTGTYWSAAKVTNVTGQMRFTFPASTGRFYQLVFSTNLFGASNVVDLGWGQVGMAVTNDSPGAWFGAVRVRLQAP
ncbi:MAG: MBG domain-containing protein [Kiritimatiellia bacterium]